MKLMLRKILRAMSPQNKVRKRKKLRLLLSTLFKRNH